VPHKWKRTGKYGVYNNWRCTKCRIRTHVGGKPDPNGTVFACLPPLGEYNDRHYTCEEWVIEGIDPQKALVGPYFEAKYPHIIVRKTKKRKHYGLD
jgi:hypothetical protein